MADKKFFNYHQLSSQELNNIKLARWKCRYDLKYLCNKVLGYKDVSTEVHGALLNTLQQFPKPNDKQFKENDDLSTGFIKYKPLIRIEDFAKQEKWKRRLFLDFRGSLKTTVNASAHALQWILNYPNTSILIVQSNIEKSEEILAEIKRHFQFNEVFRQLFPEHVPQKKIYDWGTKGAFTTEARDYNNLDLGIAHKEETVITGGIDKGLAGKHCDVIKFSDIVDPNNTKTPNSCAEIIKQYYLCENLLTSPIYWIDVEGTRYSFADLYGKIIESEQNMESERRMWKIYVRGCYKKKTKDGLPQKFTPDELFLPDLVEESEKNNLNPEGKVSWWPERYPVNVLEHKRLVSPFEFATQMYNNPQAAEEGMVPFPVIEGKYPIYLKKSIFDTKIPKAYYEISIDTAETDHQKSNYSALVVACWTGNGNCVVVDIIHGKFLPDILITKIYLAYLKYRPRNIKIEETSFTRGLMAGIRREGEKMGIHLPVQMIKRENQTAKQERIQNTLQPYYIGGQLRFLDTLFFDDKGEETVTIGKQIKKELREFPSGSQDDILDAIADLFQNKEYFGREFVREEDILMENRSRGERLHQEYLKALPALTNMYLDSGLNSYPSNDYDRTGGL